MTPEEIQNMTIREYAEFRELDEAERWKLLTTPQDDLWKSVESVRRKMFPNGIQGRMETATWYDERSKMSEAEYKELLDALKPSEDEVRRSVESLLASEAAAEEEKERIALREQLKEAQGEV